MCDLIHLSINTLGQVIMTSEFWDDNDLSERIIQDEWDGYHLYGEHDFDITLSAAIYFCLKYLKPAEVATWTESLIQIDGRYWQFFLMKWLFSETFQLLIQYDVEDLPETKTIKPKISFGVNAQIAEFYLPTANVLAFINVLKAHKLYLSLSTQ